MQVTDFKTADNYWSTNEHLFIMHVFFLYSLYSSDSNHKIQRCLTTQSFIYIAYEMKNKR